MDNLMLASVFSMAGLAILFAAILGVADKKLKVEEDPKVDAINHLLPGVNCGACGFLSCHDFAEHIVAEGVDPGKCRVVEAEAKQKICEISGIEGGESHQEIPLVHCAAETEQKEPIAEYNGIKTCLAANLNFSAGIACQYACLAFGDCVRECPFGALVMENGLPKLDQEKCTGCGKCATTCPKGIIKMQAKKREKLFYVSCSSHDTVLRTRQVCKVGCITCGICVKLSQEGFFELTDNLSNADYSKQDKPEEIEKIQAKCPTKVIKTI